MRISRLTFIVLMLGLFTACVPSLLIGNKMQSKLMWAFIKPLVGFDPNDVNFFETPMVKDRMTALLGNKYEPTMKLLKTANQIHQEGALFYVISRYGPPEAKAITDTASMIWNADTNQMAVMLVKDGTPEIISEQMDAAKQALIPMLPKEVQSVYNHATEAKRILDEQKQKIENMQKAIPPQIEPMKQTLDNLPPLENLPSAKDLPIPGEETLLTRRQKVLG
jgi:hypothetical protein